MPTYKEMELRKQELIEEEELRKWQLAFGSMCELCPEGRQTWVTMTLEELQHEIRVLIFDDEEYPEVKENRVESVRVVAECEECENPFFGSFYGRSRVYDC